MDLMSHDLDVLLSVVKSNIKKIRANGVKVFGDTPDIVNAVIEFVTPGQDVMIEIHVFPDVLA